MKLHILTIIRMVNNAQVPCVVMDSDDLTPAQAIEVLFELNEKGHNYAHLQSRGNHFLIYKPSAE
ncbi:MAG: hypothetical protein EBR82_48525 [Caulobacteraceae bacterium]|nr:hypothetical protein [Caulobacteraceae bacterium]